MGFPLRMSGVIKLSSAVLNDKVRTMHRMTTEIKGHQTYIITLQARTTEYFNKGLIQIRVNNKSVGTCCISNRYAKPIQIIWENRDATEAMLSLHLLDYDGDGETIECNMFDFQAVGKNNHKY